MKILAASALLLAGAAIPAASMAQPALSGRWSQASNGSELVLVSRIKLEPNVGVPSGTSLGGSVGYGSPTRTVIATEPVPMQVKRTMSLTVAPDGSFKWLIEKAHAETQNGTCIKTTRIEKHGQVVLRGGKAAFSIQRGTESWEKSCGGAGSAAVKPSTETYDAVVAPAQLRLLGGATAWTFKRG